MIITETPKFTFQYLTHSCTSITLEIVLAHDKPSQSDSNRVIYVENESFKIDLNRELKSSKATEDRVLLEGVLKIELTASSLTPLNDIPPQKMVYFRDMLVIMSNGKVTFLTYNLSKYAIFSIDSSESLFIRLCNRM
ncbi:hypothetical protein BpHYR1_000176 [Brachionus plicatilis]|uniref:Uncharacterized protein n=1 Tax=Brachionus plicatilis TaxID=10195 RepID=A0A3M7R5B3_BRAPC|nr:hypothetical protein BpHYR1_000176 [Brachionus plicatilis]